MYRRSVDGRQGIGKSEGCGEEEKLGVPSLWSHDGSTSPTDYQEFSSFAASDDMNLSQCSVPLNYDTARNSEKIFKELNVSSEVISGQIVSHDIPQSGNPSDAVTCELNLPNQLKLPRIVVTDFEGSWLVKCK